MHKNEMTIKQTKTATMKKNIVNELIIEMKKRIPEGQSIVNYLTDVLCMGKEAIYRRLRGEVAFTFQEIALISHKLGISIDQIIGNHLGSRVTFDLNLLHSDNPLESYYEILTRYLQIFNYLKGEDNLEIYTASNVISFTLYSSYEHLSKFRLMRWVYQNDKIKTPNSLADFQAPEKVIQAHKKLSEVMKESNISHFIWDANIFISFIKEVAYFNKLNLISDEDVKCLKEDLYQLVSQLEQLSIQGEFKTGHKVSIYLSNIDIEATYSYVRKKEIEFSLLRVYSINSMDSQNPYICETQKNWIQSLKRHSTLISGSGEAERIAFFEEQRRHIGTL